MLASFISKLLEFTNVPMFGLIEDLVAIILSPLQNQFFFIIR